MKTLTIPLLIFSIYAYAGLSQVQQISFTPSTDTQGARAEAKADNAITIGNNALTKANSVEGIAQDAHSMANSFKKVATTPNSCLNNTNFTCTDNTFDSGHQFSTKTYTPGTYYFTVPAGITKIYASIQGPAGSIGSGCQGFAQYSTYCRTGISGFYSYIKLNNKQYNSPYGKPGDAGRPMFSRPYDDGYPAYIGYDNYTPNNYSLDVNPGQQVTVYVGKGGSGTCRSVADDGGALNTCYMGGTWKGHDGKVEIRY
jgi:hypothetical protein